MEPQNQRKTRRTVLAATGVAAAFGLAGCVSGNDDDDGDGTEPDTENGGTDAGEADQAGGDERTVTLLVEGAGGHSDGDDSGEEHDHSETEGEHDAEGEHDDGHDAEEEHDDEGEHNHSEGEDESEGHDYGDEGLTSEELGHACNHMTEVEEFGAEDVDAGASAEEAPHLSEVHHPYSVTFEGESGYVRFELGDHAHSEGDEHDHDEEDEHDGEQEDEHDGEMLAFFTQSGVASVVEGELVYSETEGVESCDSIDRYVVVEAHDGSAVVELTAGL